MREIIDTAAARLFRELADIIVDLDDEIPREEQATYAVIIAVRLAAWFDQP